MTMMGKTCSVRARAFFLSWDTRARRAAMSPLRTECLDIFSPPPGVREVMTQVERLSSRDTKIALRSVRTAVCSLGRGQRACMVAPAWEVQHPHSAREQDATNRAHGIFGEAGPVPDQAPVSQGRWREPSQNPSGLLRGCFAALTPPALPKRVPGACRVRAIRKGGILNCPE